MSIPHFDHPAHTAPDSFLQAARQFAAYGKSRD
jgi:hypothetical protein